MKKKELPDLPFTLEQFRADVLSVMGGKEDGAFICRYCNRPLDLDEIAVDHAMPLSRGGGIGLDNLDYPCKEDNQRKGSMDPNEYMGLLKYLDTIHPLARQDILSRLQKAVTLAAGTWHSAAVINELKNTGQWQNALKTLRHRKQEKELGPF